LERTFIVARHTNTLEAQGQRVSASVESSVGDCTTLSLIYV